jgi:hypothetical protein
MRRTSSIKNVGEEGVLLRNGKYYSLAEIYESVSVSLFQSKLHYEIAEYFCKLRCIRDADIHKVVGNIYATKSSRIRMITAFVWFVIYYGDEVHKVYVNKDLSRVIAYKGLEIDGLFCLGDWGRVYVDRGHVKGLLLKGVANKIFRFLSRKIPVRSSLVRGWVEVTTAMYNDVMSKAMIRIFPFPFGLKRQIAFILSCRKRGLDFSLDGIPYSLLDICMLAFAGDDIDEKIAAIELKANRKYASVLVDAQVTTVFTSDEFEVASFAIYDELLKMGSCVVNTAHGIGLYCPNVSYSCFRGFSIAQSDFYSKSGELFRSEIRSSNNLNLPFSPSDKSVKKRFAVVLVHQNFSDYQLKGDGKALFQVAKKLDELCAFYKLQYFVKLHPNTTAREEMGLPKTRCAKFVKDWDFIDEFYPLFFIINSTAYFDVKNYGSVFVYRGPSFFPETYFGSDAKFFDVDSLPFVFEDVLGD